MALSARLSAPRSYHLRPHMRIRRPLLFADLFAGLGGFHVALSNIGARCVWACENNPIARVIYEANYQPGNPELFASGNFASDITQINPAEIPDFDILCAGFPCQPFSEMGRRGGLRDPRGQLFFHIADIIAEKQPAAFLLENVPGLRTIDNGRVFRRIQRILTRLGYSFHWETLWAKDFGVPQRRPRIYMVGFRDTATPFTWPEPMPLVNTLGIMLGGKCDREYANTLLTGGYGKRPGTRGCFDAYTVNGETHRLTIAELLALQGFPQGTILPTAKCHARVLIGNAIAVPVAQAVAAQIAEALRPKLSGPLAMATARDRDIVKRNAARRVRSQCRTR